MSRWTPVLDDRVAKLWQEGFSAQAIAKLIGDGASRSGVISRLTRIGKRERSLISTSAMDAYAMKLRMEASARRQRAAQEGRSRAAGRAFVSQATKTPPNPETPANGPVIPLMALQSHSCRWPIGDPSRETFGFCGVRKDVGRSYCVAHARQAVQVQHGDKRLFRLERLG